MLEIAAVSHDFTRSSAISLDGQRAPRLSVFEYPNLPAGEYEVTAFLHGSRGTRATARMSVRIVPYHPFLTHPYEMGLMKWV